MFYYGWGYDPTIILLIPAIILTMFAQAKVKSAFSRWSQVPGGTGLTGAQAARKVLDQNGLYDVPIVPVRGSLTDHYDPRDRSVHLSETVFNSDSVSAVGVACHECGHAIQHANGYFPLRFRDSIVPVVNFASQASWILIMIGLVLLFNQGSAGQMGDMIFNIGVIAFLIVILFHLITLPVEFNASRRAVAQIEAMQLVAPGNERGVKKVLKAAALTYVAALAVAVANLLRILAIRGRRD